MFVIFATHAGGNLISSSKIWNVNKFEIRFNQCRHPNKLHRNHRVYYYTHPNQLNLQSNKGYNFRFIKVITTKEWGINSYLVTHVHALLRTFEVAAVGLSACQSVRDSVLFYSINFSIDKINFLIKKLKTRSKIWNTIQSVSASK